MCVWTENNTALPPRYRYDAFETYLTNIKNLPSNYTNPEEIQPSIIPEKWTTVKDFLKTANRQEAITNLKIKFYDGEVLNLDYLMESYEKYRSGDLFLPQVDSKTQAVRMDSWAITRDSCMALGEVSYFMSCQDPGSSPLDCGPNAGNHSRIVGDYRWVKEVAHFDNIGQGLMSLLQISTFMGWEEVVFAGIDSTRINQQPAFENSMGYYVYFIMFVLLGSFFTLNLFVGVLIDNFNQQKEKKGGKSIWTTEKQKIDGGILGKYANQTRMEKSLVKKRPNRPNDRFRGTLWRGFV